MNKKINEDLLNWDRQRTGQPTEDLRELWDMSDRFGQSFEVDVESGLEKLHQKLAADQPAVVKRIPLQRRAWLRIAAALVGLGLLGGWWYQQQAAEQLANWAVVSTEAGEQRELVLPDGSTVTLNENSRLSYRTDLATAAERELELRGEAFFEVKRAPEQPFRIQTAGVEVRVLGTAFNLRAPADGQSAEVAVTHGRVAFQVHETEAPLIVEKGGIASWQFGQLAQVQQAKVTDNYRAWHSGKLQFKDTPLTEVLELLTRTYGVSIEQAAPLSGTDCRLTGRWEQLSAEEAMELLAALTGFEISATHDNSYLLKGACQ